MQQLRNVLTHRVILFTMRVIALYLWYAYLLRMQQVFVHLVCVIIISPLILKKLQIFVNHTDLRNM